MRPAKDSGELATVTSADDEAEFIEDSEETVLFKEQLIELVRKYPVLYDPADAQYKKRDVRMNTWLKIGADLGKQHSEFKKEWESLRKVYFVNVKRKKGKSGDAAKRRGVRWPYFDLMTFLGTATHHRK
jgi:hypothetical protein